ncbi:leucine-rich repeat-containing protein 26-like [Pollicipes pollicipes]|uniref:leucine-rich repeat-containing protein 26-like n=1 Tax=Pollicipes pollicipes TaxID=41117 RepID=UPI0018853C66|nr:leucine-rich repeat-containing protein 26-like [Pollicipes pollicipes]
MTRSWEPGQCKWRDGKEAALCVNASLVEVPSGLDAGTQVLRLDGNRLQVLTADTFSRRGLLHLQRLSLAACRLGHIDQRAFAGLANLVQLDLSRNLLLLVPSDSLKRLVGLRELRLGNNLITRLWLRLDNNRLTTLPADSLTPLASVRELHLHGNAWSCDCRVRPLKRWLERTRPSHAEEPRCAEPLRLRDAPFGTVRLGQFSCPPVIRQGARRHQAWAGDNVTLSRKTSMLTIQAVRAAAAGRYICEARNSAGRVTRPVTVSVTEREGVTHLTLKLDRGLLLGALVVGLLLSLACVRHNPYTYHAVQLDRYLLEYRSLQDQLAAMQRSCHNLSTDRRRSQQGLKPILKSHEHVTGTAQAPVVRRAPYFAATDTYFSYSES